MLMNSLKSYNNKEVDPSLKKNWHDEESGEEEMYQVDQAGGKQKRVSEATSMGFFSIQQLQDMIANTIIAQYGGTLQDVLMYSNPYTKRIDSLWMPIGYQPPMFMQFDRNGNPKLHVAQFVESCNNAGMKGDHLMKQFVRNRSRTQQRIQWIATTAVGLQWIATMDAERNEEERAIGAAAVL